jgi:putative acetyltransferase
MSAAAPAHVRHEVPADQGAIRAINEGAFGGSEEADLIEALRAEGAVLLSLVAEHKGRLAGHVLFSRMFIDTAAGPLDAVALAPVAVLPALQHLGIGAALIRAGLEALSARGERIVLVVGHPTYYPRFGFSADLARPLDSPFAGDAFMALELIAGALEGVRGKVRYAKAFGPVAPDP